MSKAYLKKAEDSLRATSSLKNNQDWEISTPHYCTYCSIYVILMKLGIKCEIHSCTIEFLNRFLNPYFTNTKIELVVKAQKARIDTKYYSNRNISLKTYLRIINNTAQLFTKCKFILNKIDEITTKQIRAKLLI